MPGREEAPCFYGRRGDGSIVDCEEQLLRISLCQNADERSGSADAAAGQQGVLQKIAENGGEFRLTDGQLLRQIYLCGEVNARILCFLIIIADDRIYGKIFAEGTAGVRRERVFIILYIFLQRGFTAGADVIIDDPQMLGKIVAGLPRFLYMAGKLAVLCALQRQKMFLLRSLFLQRGFAADDVQCLKQDGVQAEHTEDQENTGQKEADLPCIIRRQVSCVKHDDQSGKDRKHPDNAPEGWSIRMKNLLRRLSKKQQHERRGSRKDEQVYEQAAQRAEIKIRTEKQPGLGKESDAAHKNDIIKEKNVQKQCFPMVCVNAVRVDQKTDQRK